MPNSIGTAFVDVAFDPKQIQGQLGGLGGKVEGGFSKMGGKWGAAAATGFGAAIIAGVAVGKYLYDVGSQFDDMADTIRVSTGKTGKELDALVETAKGVGTDVPTSFENAGKAVANLSTRLGLTGKPLRTVSDQVLELSRLSGTDLTSSLNSVTRMLGDAGLKGADASEGIDKIWRAAQASQVPVGRLMDLMTKFGGPLRQLGFSFDEQAAMLAKFEKEGVNTELVMGSMRIALGKMAKAGKDPVVALRETIAAIKDTGDAGEANRKAIELFGARAGPDMAAAIREGRFSIDDLVKTIAGGKDTVLGASADTQDFSEQWLIFKNKVSVAVAPAAEALFNAVGKGMAYINENAGPLMQRLKTELMPTFVSLGKTADDLGSIIHDLEPVFRVAFQLITNEVKTMVAVIGGLATAVGGVVKIVKSLLEGDWRGAWNGAKQVVSGLATAVEAILSNLLNRLKLIGGLYLKAGTALGRAIVDGAKAGLAALAGIVSNAVSSAAGSAAAAAVQLGAAIVAGLRSGLSTVGAVASAAVGGAKAAVVGAFAGAATWLYATGADVIRGLGNGIDSMGDWAAGKAHAVVSKVKSIVTGPLGFITGSPSKWAIEQGKWVGIGLGKGLELSTQEAVDKAKAMAQKTMDAARAPLEAGVAAMQAQLSHGFEAAQGAIKTPAEKALAALQAKGVAAMADSLTPAEKALAALQAKGVQAADDGLTKAERQLAALADARAEADRQDALADAKEKQRQAVTDDEKVAAAKAVGDAQYAITVAALTKQAEAEKQARDDQQAQRQADYDAQVAALQKQAAAEQTAREAEQTHRQADYDARVVALTAQAEQERTNLDARQFLQQQSFDKGLASLTTYLESSKATAAGAQKKIEAFMRKWGISFGDLGTLLGTAFAKGVKSTTKQVESAAADLKAIVEDALDFVRRANAELAKAPKSPAAGGKASSSSAAVAASTSSALTARALAPSPLAGGAAAGGTLYGVASPFAQLTRAVQASAAAARDAGTQGPTIVRVYIGDQELRGIVRTEVGYLDDETARVALAGLVGVAS